MGEFVIKMPDVGEGIAEAELVEWHVKVGDLVREDMVLAAVMTDKATVEIPSSVDGEVLWLGADLGMKVAIGSPIIRIKVTGEGNVAEGASDSVETAPEIAIPIAEPAVKKPVTAQSSKVAISKQIDLPRSASLPHSASLPRSEGEKPLASPSVRARAREAGIDLRLITGSGPAGRIIHDDLDHLVAQSEPQNISAGRGGFAAQTDIEEVKVIGLRRKIAEKMALSKSRIPHIMYAEEIDVTALEDLRQTLNQNKKEHQPRLTILPFLMRAMVKALADNPQLNARYDDEAGVVHRYAGVHIGIATQTSAGLVVPVVKHAEARDLWDCATELNRLSEAAKMNTISRDELTGSTITISSLGAMGGLVSTPVINHPEVAIVGVNKITIRPVWDGAGFVPRKMMNLSSSFDHRVIDGWDAAVFIQRLKTLLETPALIFIEG